MSTPSASLSVVPLPAFNDNYLWLLCLDGMAWVVDPGDAHVVDAALQAQGVQLVGILLTHHHADHTAGAAALQQRWRCPVYAPDSDHPAYQTCQCLTVHEGDVIDVFPLHGIQCQVLALPGHTLDHIAYLIRAPGPSQPAASADTVQTTAHLFSGDVLFGAGCGRLFEGSPAQMYASLQRIAALPADTWIYPAHEYTEHNLAFAYRVDPDNPALQARIAETTAIRQQGRPSLPTCLSLELATNPFLRCAQLAQSDAFAGQSALQVFTTLRAQRNQF